MDWKLRGRILGTLILGAAFVSANAGISAMPVTSEDPETVEIDVVAFDAAMTHAQSEARRHLDRFFLHVLEDDGRAQAGAAVKITLAVGDQPAQAVWITPFAQLDGDFIGILANTPAGTDELALGDAVMFSADQVRDWYFYGRDGKMYGSYTTRAMLPQLHPVEAAEIAALLSEAPLPDGWLP